MLLFGTMFSSRALAVASGVVLVSLLLIAWLHLRGAERRAYLIRAMVAALAAGTVGFVVALLLR